MDWNHESIFISLPLTKRFDLPDLNFKKCYADYIQSAMMERKKSSITHTSGQNNYRVSLSELVLVVLELDWIGLHWIVLELVKVFLFGFVCVF